MNQDTVLIDKIKSRFNGQRNIKTGHLLDFLKTLEPETPESTLSWKIYQLKEAGHLTHIGRGEYSFNGKPSFTPQIGKDLKKLFDLIHKDFPYLEICIWDSLWLNEFMIHQPSRSIKIIETEKDGLESVFNRLTDQRLSVFLYKDKDIMERYGSDNPIVLKPLLSEAPKMTIEDICTVNLEKMLVDCLIEKAIFSAQQEEIKTIWKAAYEKYNINISKARRYARRRGQLKPLDALLEELNINFMRKQ